MPVTKTKPTEEEVHDDLMRRVNDALTLEEKMKLIYNFLGHPGEKSLYMTLKPLWGEKGLKDIIHKLRTNCINCQQNTRAKSIRPKRQELGQLSTITPCTDICSDIFGPFEMSSKKKKYWMITVTDRYSRWTRIYTTTTIDAHAIIATLKKWIQEFGAPKTFLHDQGLQYIAKETQDFLKKTQDYEY